MLGFTLSEEQEAFRQAVRALAEGMLAPQVEELEAKEQFPLAVFRELGRLGYLGVGVPEAEGGSGGDTVMRALLLEEIARVNCGLAAALIAHVGRCTTPLIRFGTPGQRERYLKPALSGTDRKSTRLNSSHENVERSNDNPIRLTSRSISIGSLPTPCGPIFKRTFCSASLNCRGTRKMPGSLTITPWGKW